MATDRFIVFAPDVPEEEGRYPAPFDKERLGFFRDLGRAAGSKSIGLVLDRIPPGERMSFTHAHFAAPAPSAQTPQLVVGIFPASPVA
jgi:uncharacterized cupin superfamily protein